MKTISRERLKALEGLRGISFLAVFVSHIGVPEIECFGLWAVSVFLTMSGFLMTYNYYDSGEITKSTVISNLLFALKKIRYLYPVHIITMCCFIIFEFIYSIQDPLNYMFIQILLNVLMIQEWTPIYHISINLVSWYLCTLFFTYFIFPFIIRYMEKKHTIRKAFYLIILSIICQSVIGLMAKELSNLNIIVELCLRRNLIAWFTYYFPLSRFFDFFIGCNLAYVFMKQKHTLSKDYYSIIEILLVIMAVIPNVMFQMIYPLHPEAWYIYVVGFTISTAPLIYILSVGKGFISRIIYNKLTRYLARISPYGFLIHYVVFEYLYYFVYKNLQLKEFAICYQL